MARRGRTVTATTTGPTEKQRNRRTPDQIVADLQAEIEAVKARAAAKEARANPQSKALLVATKALDKAAENCAGDAKHALEAARALLGEQMLAMGVRAPQTRRRRQEAAQSRYSSVTTRGTFVLTEGAIAAPYGTEEPRA